MKPSSPVQYQAREFARLAGVTVRALHHYDRLSLLKPSGRTAAGYRVYSQPDFARLQQIVTLKFIGFSLRQIKQLIAGADLRTALRLQRASLEEKRRHLDQAIAAVVEAERMMAPRRTPDWRAFAAITQRIQMQNNDLIKKYYNDEAQKLLAERQTLWSPELQQRVEREWLELFADIKAALAENVKPESARGKALAGRHTKLIEAFTGGHAPLEEGARKVWQDFDNLPAANQDLMRPFKDAINPEINAFIEKAKAARA